MRRILPLLLCLLLFPAVVHAGGVETPTNGTVALGRGGAYTALANDLVALDYNPAGLLKIKGNQVYVGNNIINYDLTFTGIGTDGNSVAPVSNGSGPMVLAPFVGAASDFGLKNWRFALGVYGPSANGVFDLPEDPKSDDERRPHHFLMQEMEVLMAFYTLGVAYGDAEKWGVGVDLHWVHLMGANMTMWVDAYDPELPKGSFFREDGMDVRARTSVSDPGHFAATLGGWVKPLKGLEIGASFRFPNVYFTATGHTTLEFEDGVIEDLYAGGIASGGKEGLLSFTDDGELTGEKVPTTLKFAFPMKARLGVRYAYEVECGEATRELWDIELDGVWEGWSVLEDYRVELRDYMEIQASWFKPEEGARTQFRYQPISIPRHYKDTWSARLGGQYAPLPWLTLRAGSYYETGATPKAYTNVDFASFDRLGVAGGLSFEWRWVTLSMAYAHVFQATREVTLDETQVYQAFALSAEPSTDDKYKVGAGTFETSYDLFSMAVAVNF